MTMFYALKLSSENAEWITTQVPSLTLDVLKSELELSLLHSMDYYFVPDYVGKNMGEVYPWVLLRSDYLAENFNYTLPENDKDKFEITRK